jgi:mannose-1-phosphate guanylyltransferase
MAIVILAGGGGTRLWPISRRNSPKQHQRLIGRTTLLEETFRRLRRVGFPPREIFVSAAEHARRTLARELPRVPRDNFFLEPERRDTAAALGYVATLLARRNPRTVFTTANSDAAIRDEAQYAAVLNAAQAEVKARPHRCVLVGIPPTYPETGYGYIEAGRTLGKHGRLALKAVRRFREKPDRKTAARYVASGRFLWNPAIFTWRVDHLLARFRRFLPKHARALTRIAAVLGTPRERTVTRAAFRSMPKISIDYGIMEKDRDLAVLPAALGWTDVGHWRAVHAVLAAEEAGANVVRGRHVGLNTRGLFAVVPAGKVLATASVQDLVIVDTPDALLVCSRDAAQDVKLLVERLREEGLERLL